MNFSGLRTLFVTGTSGREVDIVFVSFSNRSSIVVSHWTHSVEKLANKPRRPSHLQLSRTETILACPCIQPFPWMLRVDSSPHASVASTLLTESSPRLSFWLFKNEITSDLFIFILVCLFSFMLYYVHEIHLHSACSSSMLILVNIHIQLYVYITINAIAEELWDCAWVLD